MSDDKKEYDLKMQEYAQLLDIRADRIRVSITITCSLFFEQFSNYCCLFDLLCARFIDFTIYDHNLFS